jgi:predicted transcriptional regulator
VTTFTIELEPEAADLVRRVAESAGQRTEQFIAAAAELIAREEASAEPTSEEQAVMARALADVEAGRLTDHDEVFARLEAKYG